MELLSSSFCLKKAKRINPKGKKKNIVVRWGRNNKVCCTMEANLLNKLYATLPKYFFTHPSFSYVLLCKQPHQYNWNWDSKVGGKLLIANHKDQSIWWANEKHWAAVRSNLLHSFLQVHSTAGPRTSHGNLRNYPEAKTTIFLSQTGTGSIFFIHLYCAGSHTEHRWDALYSTACSSISLTQISSESWMKVTMWNFSLENLVKIDDDAHWKIWTRRAFFGEQKVKEWLNPTMY
jgi:hypothetical protein